MPTKKAKKKTAPVTARKKTSKATAHQEPKSVVAELVDDDHEILEQPTPVEPDESNFDIEDETAAIVVASKPVRSSERGLATTDPLTMYLNEVRKYPLLTREEELKIAKRYFETKDPEAAQLLVKSNLRFVIKVAAEYSRFSSRMIDLIQEGNVGLMHAVKEYNPYKGARLITYAVWWIRGYIQEYLMRQFSMVRIGTTANQRKLFYQLQKQKEELEKMASPENIALLSHKLGIPEDEVAEMAKRLSGRDVSLDKPAGGDDDSVSLGSLLRKDDGGMPLDEKIALEEQIDLLHKAVDKIRSSLSEKEKILLEERVLNDEPLTLQEIGEKYGITREAVRQSEVRLINKIKAALGNI